VEVSQLAETTAVMQGERREEGGLRMQKRNDHQHHLHTTGKQNGNETGKGGKQIICQVGHTAQENGWTETSL